MNKKQFFNFLCNVLCIREEYILAIPKTQKTLQSVLTHLWGFFFFIIFAETPACSEEKNETKAHSSNTSNKL